MKPMKLLVFGATGGTGRQLVEQAVAQGHDVTAFVRNPSAFGFSHGVADVMLKQVADDTYLHQKPGVSR